MPQLPVKVEAMISGAWTDITAYVYTRDGLEITRGRPDETATVDPSSCRFTLNNRDGRFSPRNPTSPYYGLIGRNTPIRASINSANYVAASTVDLVDKTAQAAPSVTSPTNSARLFCAWANPTPSGSYTYPGGMTGTSVWTDTKSTMGSAHEAISATGATGTRTATAGLAEDYLSASVLLNGSITVQETETDVDGILATDSGTQVGWWILLFSYWAWDDEDVAIPHFPVSTEGGWILVADTDTINVADADAAFFRMKAWIKKVKNPGAHSILIGGPSTSLSVMRVLSGVTDWSPRFYGEVVAWPQRWDASGRDVYVPLEAAGVMRRLGQGASPLSSALARRVPTRTPSRAQYATGQGVVAYWPMEDAAGSTVFASGLPGGTPMSVSGRTAISFAGQDGPPGSSSLPVFDNGASAFGAVPATTPYSSNPTIIKNLTQPWRVDSMFFVETQPPADRTCLTVYTSSDTAARWEFRCGSDLKVEVADDTDTVFHTTSQTLPTNFYGNWIHFDLRVTQSGSTVSYTAHAKAIDGTTLATWSTSLAGTRSAGRPQKAGLRVLSEEIRSIGHVCVSQDSTTSPVDPFDGAVDGYTGETAADRVERLCDEEDLDCMVIADEISVAAGVVDSMQMGPQGSNTLLELLKECAEADSGILYEPRELVGIAFRTRRSLYNQPAVFPLHYTAKVFGSAPEPIDDDQLTRNDITANREGGSSYRAILDEGALSIQPPPDGVGRYDDSITVNIKNDSDLPDVAGWRLHLGTVDEGRYPLIHLSMNSAGFTTDAVLSAAAATLDVGDRFTIDNMPAWIPPDLVTLLAQGFAESITSDGVKRDVVVNCTPELPWQVAIWQTAAGATGDKWDTAGSELASGITSTATSLSVATTKGPVWTDDNAEDGFDIVIGGERMTVTDIAGTTSPQTFTVTRSINSVVKAHSAGADVRLYKTPIWAL